MSSCVKLYKSGLTCADAPQTACCTKDDKYIWANVWSLSLANGTDHLVTPLPSERDYLKAHGWVENCVAQIGGPTDFCVDGSPDGRNGPFIVFNTLLPDTVPIYRCITPNTKHFLTNDNQCEGMGKAESLIGYASTSPRDDTVRALRRCTTADRTAFFHALDLACDINDSLILGWVR